MRQQDMRNVVGLFEVDKKRDFLMTKRIHRILPVFEFAPYCDQKPSLDREHRERAIFLKTIISNHMLLPGTKFHVETVTGTLTNAASVCCNTWKLRVGRRSISARVRP